MRVELSQQVVDSVRKQAPEPRRFLRQALRNLANERGDIRSLEPPLDGFCRLRVRGYRIIFAYGPRQTVQCIFAQRRSIVYDIFEQVLADKLSGSSEE